MSFRASRNRPGRIIMAEGSWMGIYIQVSDDLMAQRREQELLLLMAIMRHCDRLGFCYPGRARLMAMRRCSQPVYERRLSFLEDCGYVVMTESYDYRRRQAQFDFQVSPKALYIREEFQEYCQAVFDGVQERDFALEKCLLENHFSTNDSQPEVVNRIRNQTQEPASGTTRKTNDHNQRSRRAETQEGRNPSTMRNRSQTASAEQPTATDATAHRENYPQAGGPVDLETLIMDEELLIKAIMHVASTTEHQARDAVATYPIDQIMHWLRKTDFRRRKGELKKPGGYFFKMLGLYAMPIDPAMPNGQTYQDFENDHSEDVEL